MSQLPLFGTSTMAPVPLSHIEVLRQSHEAKRAELMTSADELLRDMSTWAELPGSAEAVARMIGHPKDLARIPVDNVTFDYYTIGQKPIMKMPETGRPAYLITYRVQVGRETAFGIFNQRECVIMRARPFIEQMLPADDYDDPQVEESYALVQRWIDAISTLSPSSTS